MGWGVWIFGGGRANGGGEGEGGGGRRWLGWRRFRGGEETGREGGGSFSVSGDTKILIKSMILEKKNPIRFQLKQ